MIGNLIIAFIVFGAFFRAAKEYNQSGIKWGGIGVASFFVPNWIILFVVTLAAGPANGGVLSLASLSGLVLSIVFVVWVYNKLMDRAIEAQAAYDAQVSALKESAGNR